MHINDTPDVHSSGILKISRDKTSKFTFSCKTMIPQAQNI